MARAIDVNRPTATRLGTVLVPVQDSRGNKIVFELSGKMWRDMRGEIDECFERVRREAEQGAAILAIERHESVV